MTNVYHLNLYRSLKDSHFLLYHYRKFFLIEIWSSLVSLIYSIIFILKIGTCDYDAHSTGLTNSCIHCTCSLYYPNSYMIIELFGNKKKYMKRFCVIICISRY